MVKRVFTPEQDKEVARLYVDEGLSTIKIAKRYGVDKGSVTNALNRQGIKRRRGTVEPTRQDVITGMKQFGNWLLTPSEVEQVYKIYSVGGFSLNQISIAYGFGKSGRGLSAALKRQGYKLRGGKQLTSEQEDEAIKLYQEGMSARQAGEKFGVTAGIVLDALNRRNDAKTRKTTRAYKYQFNPHAFDAIDNEQAAYWLGFLYADGLTYRGKVTVIHISLRDIDHIRRFKDFMQSDHRIYETEQMGFGIKSKKAIIMITHPHLAQSLSSKGIVKDRTNLAGMLQTLPPGLERHFIRGYLDGDGCIRGAYNPSVTFTGQHDLLEWIRATFYENLGTNPDLGIMNGKGICSINYCGIRQAKAIINWLYEDATVWMPRKREKAEQWI